MKAFFNVFLLKLAVLLFIFISCETTAQPIYTIRIDPANNKRKIIDIKPAVRKATTVQQLKNGLDAVNFKRPPLPFRAFEMRNPKTRKELNPDAMITIRINDSVKKTTTIRQFYEELNEMERQLTARGRTLRVKSTFADLKPDFVISPYLKQPKLAYGFKSTDFKVNSNPPPSFDKNGTPLANKGFVPIVMNPNFLKALEWEPNLYIADRFEDTGTPEFPAEWLKASSPGPTRKKFPLLLEVPKGFDPLIKRFDWQVSDIPFDNSLQDINVPGIKKTGSITIDGFVSGVRGTNTLPQVKKSVYYDFIVDLSTIETLPPATEKAYFIRTIAYNASNEVLKISPQVVAMYGGTVKKFKLALPEYNRVPGFNYTYPPESSVPFGLYVKGEGFSTLNSTEYIDSTYETLATKGFRFKANASLGVRYFNFMSIVNENEPASKEFNIITAKFLAAAGKGVGEPGVKLSLDIMEGLYKPEIDFTAQMPPTSTSIPINYTIKEPIDWELLNTRFYIGPVPFKVSAGIGGEAGIELGGQVNIGTGNFDFQGSIKPYLKTYFKASGGVDAFIAYATINAEVNPLLDISMPVTFSSTGKALSFTNTISGLNGRVYLAVGFYYPCPSLEKIIGFIAGDEDLPLCECRWEWNIFDFKGYNESFQYLSN